jgi:BASS family bile acid:Na+ symporter
MEVSMITRIVTPLGIAIIMLGMGLSLTPDDFKRVWVQPKPIFIGIMLQIIGLPLLGFAFITLLKLDPILAAAIMLLSACPGGAITNLVAFISKGDAALSVSLTSINSFITVLTIPLITAFSLNYFLGTAIAEKVNVTMLSLGIIIITIPPIIIGMAIKAKAPELACKSESWVRKGTIIFILFLASFACYSDKQIFLDNYSELSLYAFSLAAFSLLLGGVAGVMTRLPRKQVLTLSIEVGLHNSAMAIVIALSFLGMPALAVFSAFYLIVEYIFSGMLMATMNTSFGSRILGPDALSVSES